MTAFATCLFAIAAFASAWTILASWRRFAPAARMLRAQIAACPETLVLHWRSIERVETQPLSPIRMRRARRAPYAPGLEWPQAARQPLARAA